MTDPHSPLRLNVGFIINQSIGYFRDFGLEFPQLHLGSDLTIYDLSGTVRVTRTPQGLLMQGSLQAKIGAECARCLDDFSQELHANLTELYAFNKRSITESELILPEDGQINLDPLLREYLLLDMPIRPLCRPDCKGLCLECGENLNLGLCEHTSGSASSQQGAVSQPSGKETSS